VAGEERKRNIKKQRTIMSEINSVDESRLSSCFLHLNLDKGITLGLRIDMVTAISQVNSSNEIMSFFYKKN
jgi:hypothetical protein